MKKQDILYAQFGPAGAPEAFYASGRKSSKDMPAWLKEQQLTAYEYQCSRGVNIKEEGAAALGAAAADNGVFLSIHAPYFISLGNTDEKIIANTQNYFVKSVEAARWMGADRVIFHMGGPGKTERRAAMEQVKRAFWDILELLERQGLTGVELCPETMGKQNQLGSLHEVLELCTLAPRVKPAVDFGHLHAVSGGGYTTKADMAEVFDQVTAVLGEDTARKLHIHFSPIEFTKGGEKRHWTFADDFGPPYQPLVELCAERKLTPRIICESAGTQAADARVMRDLYFSLLKS